MAGSALLGGRACWKEEGHRLLKSTKGFKSLDSWLRGTGVCSQADTCLEFTVLCGELSLGVAEDLAMTRPGLGFHS